MSYCSVDDVIHEFHPTLKHTMMRDYGDDFEANIARHIDKAEAFVNASLSRVCSVPLNSPTQIVVTSVCKIAAYYSAIAYSEKDNIVKDKYETALAMLDYLVQADNPALIDDELSDDDKNSGQILYASDERLFTDDELGKW